MPDEGAREARVTQADREAAAAYLRNVTGTIGTIGERDIQAGKWDGEKHVQAFAKHRLASRPPVSDRDGEVERRDDHGLVRLANRHEGADPAAEVTITVQQLRAAAMAFGRLFTQDLERRASLPTEREERLKEALEASEKKCRLLTRLINGTPPASETHAYQAVGYASGWSAYGLALRKQMREALALKDHAK